MSMVWQIGKLIGNSGLSRHGIYINRIGTGGDGEVYSGMNIKTREMMAVKKVKLPVVVGSARSPFD